MRYQFPSTGDMPSRLGKAMLIAAWVVGLALLALFFQNYLAGLNNPNRSPELQADAAGAPSVVLRRNRSGNYVATGHINGQPVNFLLDTGATTVALPLPLARRLGLPLAPGLSSMTANGVVRTWSTRLDSVDIAGLAERNVRAVVMPNMPGDQALLGMSYLKRFELIQRGDTLTLRLPR
jgi:aspartyl protease family protein